MENRRERRVGEETRVATASPEAGTLAGGTASRPLRDGRTCGGVPTSFELTTPATRFHCFQGESRHGGIRRQTETGQKLVRFPVPPSSQLRTNEPAIRPFAIDQNGLAVRRIVISAHDRSRRDRHRRAGAGRSTRRPRSPVFAFVSSRQTGSTTKPDVLIPIGQRLKFGKLFPTRPTVCSPEGHQDRLASKLIKGPDGSIGIAKRRPVERSGPRRGTIRHASTRPVISREST